MESGHGEAAITLIEAGADRERVTVGLFGRSWLFDNRALTLTTSVCIRSYRRTLMARHPKRLMESVNENRRRSESMSYRELALE